MTDAAYQALRDAVNLARDEQIRRVAALKSRLHQAGHCGEAIDEAIQAWANYEKAKRLQ
ncbi:hypothetical protein G3N58_17935 [Paraburkholderia sp. Ac-20342]|uniref:hypothetical protein n=1 Tax=Paraburkholderia sp. Ac-20342 TaxID=2703889 RepID=UPI00197CC766|nr:hypothetical protein [Paraburkholderia sp. Ac-20342]MBN3848690.1 hypothetical protein [Paraburkholderia sp. Ac-20342]